jgi:hypothetical protein
MTNHTTETSPQTYARIGGLLYLVIIVAGLFGELFVRSKLVVSGDPAATANNILAYPSLWRAGIAADLLMHVCDVPLMMIIYILLRPANRNLALLALLFNLVQTAVLVANKLNLLTPLFLSESANYLHTLDSQQLQVLSYLAIKSHGYGFGFGLIFFGFVCIIEGYLIIRSEYFPKLIGVLMQIAGLCYLINSFSMILAPGLANKLFPIILLPAFIAELSFCLWLLIKGVNLRKWREKVGASAIVHN